MAIFDTYPSQDLPRTSLEGPFSPRAFSFETAHGTVHGPQFMPVGTRATVKAMTPRDLKEAGAEMILGKIGRASCRERVSSPV